MVAFTAHSHSEIFTDTANSQCTFSGPAGIDSAKFEVDADGECGLRDSERESLRRSVADTQHSQIYISAPRGKRATFEAIAAETVAGRHER